MSMGGPWTRLMAAGAVLGTGLAVVSGAAGWGTAHRLLAALALPWIVGLVVVAWIAARRLLPAALTAFVAFGLAALLSRMSGAMTVIRIIGALYLMYLGVRMILSKPHATPDVTAAAPKPPAKGGIVLQGLLVQVSNPKNLMFVLAFLPQFISAQEESPLTRMLALSAVFMLMTFAVFVLYGLAAAAVRDHVVSRPRVMTWLRRVFAGAFAGLGLKLALTER